MTAYYNEIEPYAAQWLRNLVAAGHIAPGDVDERSIIDVRPSDLVGYRQCHFFAGIGGWSLAARLAGWPDDRELWTGSCPCQPFSSAGARSGFDDPRHLWPVWQRLIAERRPSAIMGEQSARASAWLRLVRSDLEAMGYAVGAMPVEAASAGARQLRDRYWFVASLDHEGQPSIPVDAEVAVSQAPCSGVDRSRLEVLFAEQAAKQPAAIRAHWWTSEPPVGIVAYGVSGRVDQIRALGNAIDVRPATAVIGAFMECRP